MLRTWLVLCVALADLVIALAICAEPAATAAPIISHIPRQAVESSAIAKVGYSKRRHILEIEFVNGAVYRYLDVTPSIYRDLMSAESKARFYDSSIKGHYRSIRIRAQQKEQVRAK
jgi:KTSC domain